MVWKRKKRSHLSHMRTTIPRCTRHDLPSTYNTVQGSGLNGPVPVLLDLYGWINCCTLRPFNDSCLKATRWNKYSKHSTCCSCKYKEREKSKSQRKNHWRHLLISHDIWHYIQHRVVGQFLLYPHGHTDTQVPIYAHTRVDVIIK